MSVRRRSRASSRPSVVEIEVPVDPNTFTWPERSRKKFVQLVALQSLVNPAPITNEYPIILESPRRSIKCKLPQKSEREIADHFAFLAAGDGSGAACCIEEGDNSLKFRLAMNEGVPASVLEGLKGVLREVRKVAASDQIESDIKAVVWANVLELERSKVHADLVERFSRAPKPLSEQFEDALGQQNNPSSHDKLTDEEARLVLQKIFDLCTRVTTSDKDRCTRDIDRLLDTCYRFRGSRNFKSFLKAVHSRRQLVQIIEKLGRYKTASNALVLAAKKFRDLFLHVDVEAVPTLPALDAKAAAGFKGIYIGDVSQDLTHNTENMCMSRLRTITNLSNEKLAIKYQDFCQSTPTAHAEIQLVKFYEENTGIDRPTFIGCSKKACYLCGLFLQLQRRFTVSKAHQNIYHTWAVPTIRCASPENAVMLDFVVDKMSRIIEDSCKKMLWEKPDDSNLHKTLITSPPMSPGFPTPRSPLSPISPSVSRPGTATSDIYSNLHNIRAAVQQLPSLPHVSSKTTDSSSDSTSPEPSSPNLSAASSRTSVSDSSSPTDLQTTKRQPQRKKIEAPNTTERMPAIMVVDVPPLPQKSASRQAKGAPSPARSVRKRGSPVEVSRTESSIANEPMSSFTPFQSVMASRKTAPLPTPKAPAKSTSVTRKPMATPETPVRGGRVRSSSVIGTRKAVTTSDAESASPLTASHPLGPLRRANTAPVEGAKSAIPVPRSVSRSNRRATPTTPPRSPSANRSGRNTSSSRRDSDRPPSPGHITRSLRRSSPISVARFETAMAMAVTPVTGSPTMVDLPAFKGAAETPTGSPAAQTTPKTPGSEASGGVPLRKKAHKNTRASVVEKKTVETMSDAAGLGLKKSSRVSLKDSFVSAASNQSTTAERSSQTEYALSPRADSSEESAIPRPGRNLLERRGRPLKRVESDSVNKSARSTTNEDRKRAAIDRATADAAAAVQENGLEAQRKRGMTITNVVQQSGFQAQINRGMTVKRRQIPEPTNLAQTLPKNYYSDTETLRTRLRGGALSTVSSASRRSRLPGMANPAETEYTLYLAGPDHDDKTLGEKIFTGKLSDGNVGGELKQRVGCKLRTALRPAEKEIKGMRVKEVAKSLEEMVLDIFFPDAVLRLEVMWDGNF